MKRAFASLCVAASLLTSAFGATADKNVPADAVVLFDGTPASLNANWSDGRGRGSGWRVVDGAVEATRGGLHSVRQILPDGGVYFRNARYGYEFTARTVSYED